LEDADEQAGPVNGTREQEVEVAADPAGPRNDEHPAADENEPEAEPRRRLDELEHAVGMRGGNLLRRRPPW